MSQTVLVADDSQTIRKVVQMALKASEYEVVGVGSAQEAVKAAQQQPSVILLDYYMPDGSGYEVCQSIKQNAATRSIPVIMLGGTYKEFDPNLARQSGAADVVMKPFTTDDLVGAIESAVNGAAQAPAQPQQPQTTPQQAQASVQPTQQQGSRPQPPQQPQQPTPSQTPVPESQPRIPVGGGQSRAPSTGSQPQIPGSESNSGISAQGGGSGARQRKPTPPPGSSAGAAGTSMDSSQVRNLIKAEVKEIVRAELPGLLRNVMGEVFQQKVLPKLLQHSEAKIQEALDQKLEQEITHRVRLELERLLSEE